MPVNDSLQRSKAVLFVLFITFFSAFIVVVLKNDLVKRHHPLSLALRGLISNRSACYSVQILNKFKKVSMGRSYIAEIAQECQLQLYSKQNYYIEKIGNIYYSKIGVSVNIDKFEEEEIPEDALFIFIDYGQTEGERIYKCTF